MTWRRNDKVTTTFGSIKLSQKQAFEEGVFVERTVCIKMLEDYFELVGFSEEHEGAELVPDWDAGFQAALALLKGRAKEMKEKVK